MRYFAWCDYDGTDYAGWQRQPNAPSVQQTIEEALGLFLLQKIDITGCGRTDAGVHARNYCFHFDHEKDLEPESFLYKANSILPDSIAIHRIRKVTSDAHARFDALSRSYEYKIVPAKEPLQRHFAAHIPTLRTFDLRLLNEAAAFIGTLMNFGSFCKTNSANNTTQCTLAHCAWSSESGQIILRISANRFLRGMVRLIAGACLNYMTGKLTMEELREFSLSEQILPHAWSVPASGLLFTGANYPMDMKE